MNPLDRLIHHFHTRGLDLAATSKHRLLASSTSLDAEGIQRELAILDNELESLLVKYLEDRCILAEALRDTEPAGEMERPEPTPLDRGGAVLRMKHLMGMTFRTTPGAIQ